MYRLIFSLLLCAAAASAAPQRPDDTSVGDPPPAPGRLADAAPADGGAVRRARQYDFGAEGAGDGADAASPRAAGARSFGRPRASTPGARFVSELGYPDGGAAANFVRVLGKDGRRQFESHCWCEKIWNCPKLQITTPRCPDEYFLCCFT